MMNVLIAGVGGQGTLLASRVLGKYAILLERIANSVKSTV